MSGSSNLDTFHDGWLVAVQLLPLLGAASMTCSILLAVFLSSCCQAFSP